MSLTAAPLLTVIGFGLSHGVNPSHGWPVALLYSMRTTRPMLNGIITSSIIAGAHLVSSIAVVIAYILAVNLMDIQIPQIYFKYGAAIALGILAYVFWKEKGEDLVATQHGHLHDDNDN
jgi:nickel/cobalt transporter (NicO) family protein